VAGHVELLPEGQQHMLDRFQLIGEIASGGMATVYLARLPGVGGFQRFVAIKRLHPHLSREQGVVEMFLDEARLAARIHHQNVVPILEIGTSEGGYYLVMEYIEGVTLARLMTQATAKRQPIPRNVLLRIVIDTLRGLHAAHELTDDDGRPLGVVHRDCSPQNILIGLDGCTRITDFGIARASAQIHSTRKGSMKGKLAYMAPEQTQGDEFDRRADLFSVGVLLWEVLTSRRLFKGKTEAQTLRRLLHDPIPHLLEVMPDIHPALDAVCAKGLEREAPQRFQTAAEMAEAIEHAARAAVGPDAVANERAVEAVMRERYGADVSQQRDAVRTWLQATPTSFSGGGPRTARGLGESATMPRASGGEEPQPDTKRGWPVQRSSGGSGPTFEDTTKVYDPPSVAGSAGYADIEWPQSAAGLPKSGGGVRWLIALVIALGVGGMVALFVRSNMSHSDTAPAAPAQETKNEEPAKVEEPQPKEEQPKEEEPKEEPSSVASSTLEPGPRSAPRSGPRRPAPVKSASPEPPPPPPPPAPAGEMDDLQNPYR
jgi:serine/threonine-protein kinase